MLKLLKCAGLVLAALCVIGFGQAQAACPYTGNTTGTDSAAQVAALNDICANTSAGPTGGATAAKQDTGNTTLASILAGLGRVFGVNGSSVASQANPFPTLLTANGVKAGSQEYFAVVTGIAPPATPTDMNCIWGSNTKTVVVLTLGIGTNATASTLMAFHWVKRSAADTGGTFAAASPLSPDSADAAATAGAGYYTVVPSGLGTSLGDIRYDRSLSGGAVATGAPTLRGYGLNVSPTVSQPLILIAQPLVLRGTTEGVCTNFAGGVLPAGFVTDYYWQWVEY